MQIEFTTFSLRQFSPNYAGTKLPITIDNEYGHIYYQNLLNDENVLKEWKDSYQTFCKYIIIENDNTSIKSGTIKLNWFTKLFIKSGYSSRTEKELEVLSRWVKLPFWYKKPKAEYLVFVVYSREQLIKELKSDDVLGLSDDCEWGIVAILGTSQPNPDPMPPITIMRNALGVEEGGNGAKLDHSLYNESVEFWKNNILIK
ncbi:MAG: DUF3228 family protein [Spirochaetes bacterium]|nr:MAG: DUF3228 family protein [Spirochaetota bacterium]